MKIKKGTLLKVTSQRQGKYLAMAEEDFDTKTTEFYPISIAKGNGTVYGMANEWDEGERIPCRRTLCAIEIFKAKKTGGAK